MKNHHTTYAKNVLIKFKPYFYLESPPWYNNKASTINLLRLFAKVPHSQLDTSCKMHIYFQSSTTNTCTFTQLWQSIVMISSWLTIINQAFYTTTFPSIINTFSNTSNTPFIKYSTSNLKHSTGGFHVMKQSQNLVVHSNRNMFQMGKGKNAYA